MPRPIGQYAAARFSRTRYGKVSSFRPHTTRFLAIRFDEMEMGTAVVWGRLNARGDDFIADLLVPATRPCDF
jgi:hypothetical protein